MTKCTFHKFGTSGNIEKHDALCILPLNIGEISVFCFFCILPLNIGDISSRSDCIVFLYPRTMSKKAARPFCILPANIGYCQRNDPLNGITFFAVNEKIYISILTFFLFPFSSHLHFQDGMLIHNVDLTLRGAAARGALSFFRLTRDDNGIA